MDKVAQGKLGVLFTSDGFRLDVVEGELCEEAAAAQSAFEQDRYRALYYLGFAPAAPWFYPSLHFLHAVCEAFFRELTSMPELELARDDVEVVLEPDVANRLLGQRPFGLGSEHVDVSWLQTLFTRLNELFVEEIAAWSGTVELYFTERTQQLRVPERIFFHLVENRKDEECPFAFMATYATYAEDGSSKTVRHLPLRYALTEYRDDQKKLLELLGCLGRAAAKSALISELVEDGELFSALRFTVGEAYTFLREMPLYEEAGIYCRIPNWYKGNRSKVQLGVSAGEKPPSRLGVDVLVGLCPRLAVDGVELTRAEVAELLAQTEGLALLKGKWVEVDHSRLQALLDRYDEAQGGAVTLLDALRGTHSLAVEEDAEDEDWGTSNGEWLRSLRDRMQRPQSMEPPELPGSFVATLRHYQQSGYAWLDYVTALGFGACLADDMGLGKTVQVIAYLEHLRTCAAGAEAVGPAALAASAKAAPTDSSAVATPAMRALLVVPASLLGNWQQELARFAPDMPYQVLHGRPGRVLEEEFDETAFLTITSYAMAAKLACVQGRFWDAMVLDEAQAIKNPAAKQTRAIKQIESRCRIAMTGTPIENDLSNLWSLFDFLNSGLLGTKTEFATFSRGLATRPRGYARLRDIVSPFILRRLKTDKSIVGDLPSKNEIDLHVTLSKKQVVLYRKVTAELARAIEEAQGIARSGLVLTTIMKLKQICNHPSQYLGDEAFAKKDSGKFALLEELCGTIYAKRERVLVFTQFKEMCGPLDDFLAELFGRRGLVVHGSVAPKRRTALVARFQDEDDYVPYMVLSLKAGGTGLNLTAANHVIHFDRWWNPAVENQATDRAFRLGQSRDVMVYKLMADDTIEGRIAQIIADKSKLADDVIGGGASSGESWITKLDNDELMNLIRLD
ncbi:MAG: DEAD/DEAH box helicase [Gordonibacter sp.]|uniref:DEAD/DEAH box helicase n=1 Tax=Gordonibacter sp. TaxID=1968902 RepID=UPI002FCC7F83